MDAKFINAATAAAINLGRLAGRQAPHSPLANLAHLAFDTVRDAFAAQLPVTGAGAAHAFEKFRETMQTVFNGAKADVARTVVSR